MERTSEYGGLPEQWYRQHLEATEQCNLVSLVHLQFYRLAIHVFYFSSAGMSTKGEREVGGLSQLKEPMAKATVHGMVTSLSPMKPGRKAPFLRGQSATGLQGPGLSALVLHKGQSCSYLPSQENL